MHHVIVLPANIGNLDSNPSHTGSSGITRSPGTRTIRIKTLNLSLLASLVCLSTSLPAAAMTAPEYFEDGNRLFRDDLYWAALLRYRQASEAGMDTQLLHYNMGVAHYRAGQHIRARESLTRALHSPRLRVSAQYNLGLNAYAAGDNREALRWFRLAYNQQQNETIRRYAGVAINRILDAERAEDPIEIHEEKRQAEKELTRLIFDVRVSFGTDDNVFRTPDRPYIDFSDPAQPVVVPVVQSGAFMPIDMHAKYKVNAYTNEGFFGAYRLTGRYYQDKELDNGNEYLHELSFGNEYRRYDEQKNRERQVFSAFKIAQHDGVYFDRDDGDSRLVNNVALDDRFNYVRYGPEIRARQMGEKLGFGIVAKGQLWNYDDVEVVPEYDHEFIMGRLYAQYRFTPTSLLRLSGQYYSRRFGDRRARDLNGLQLITNPELRYDYVEARLTARQRISDSFWFGVEFGRTERQDKFVGYDDYIRDSYGFELSWRLGRRFRLRGAGHYREYNFDNAFAFNNPAAGPRTLESAEAELTATFRMTRSLDLVLEVDYTDTASTDIRLQYDRLQAVLGVRWSK